MDGIAAITQRMTQIQATLDSLSSRPAPSAASSAAFAQVLSQASTELAGGAGLTAAAGPAGAARNADGVPVDLARYGNGRIPAEALSPVGTTGHRLWAPAAAALEKLLAAARADGIDIGITDSYRSYDVQVDVVRRKGLYSQGGLGAVPGTSEHGWGLAADLDLDPAAQAWMRTNAGRFGFAEDVPREPWHWGFQG